MRDYTFSQFERAVGPLRNEGSDCLQSRTIYKFTVDIMLVFERVLDSEFCEFLPAMILDADASLAAVLLT